MTARRLARALGEAVTTPRLPAAGGGSAEARALPAKGASAVARADVDGVGPDPAGAEPFAWGEVASDPIGTENTDAPATQKSILLGRARRRIRFGALAALAAAGLTASLVMAFLPSASRRSSPRVSDAASQVVASHIAPRCPAVDWGCQPLSGTDGVFTLPAGRYRVGGPGDVIVLGRWTCATTALPALLRPSSGQVWVFASWARGRHDVEARLVATVPASRSLRVVAGPRGCDRLDVLRRGASPLLVHPASS